MPHRAGNFFHLHLISDATGETLLTVARAAAAQYANVSAVEHIHPLVRTHPETGSNCLYLGRRAKSYLVGMEVAQSEALLDRLWAHATQDRFTWHHRWQAGDVLMWDNRVTMHRRNAFDAQARRLLHLVVVKGTEPYNHGYDIEPHPRADRCVLKKALDQ